jgi:hypothetical protein
MNFIRVGVLIGFTRNLSCGFEGVLMGRNLSKRLGIPIATIGAVGTPQMAFTNLIMTIHENKTID